MKYLYLPTLLFCLLIGSCRKKENPPQPEQKPKVQVQTDYRLQRVYGDSGKTFQTYSYNDDNLVKTVTWVHYVMAFHYTVPDTNYTGSFYEYDDQWRVLKTANMPIEQAKEYSTFTYDNNLKPSARHKSEYTHALEQYTYDGDKLVERKYFLIKGQLYFTENWTYDSDGNAKTYIREYATTTSPTSLKKITINYHGYDKAQALRFALPGIHDIQLVGDVADPSGGVSANNPVSYERTTYYADGSSSTQQFEFRYQYNNGNFPIKVTTTIIQNGMTVTGGSAHYEYNK
jgi:hypothetical protein